LIINRIDKRANHRVEVETDTYLSIYEVIEKVTTEVVQTNRDLVGDITLGKIPESALEAVIIKIINKYNFQILNKNRDELVKEVLDHIFRYGLVQKILDIPECSGVFINGPDNVWAKIGKKMKKMPVSFGSVQNLTSFIYTIKAKLRGEINENVPLTRFHDEENKLRIVCAISPMAHMSPMIVFRKHNKENFALDDLVKLGMMTEELLDDLKRFNEAGANIIVCGKGGAGKTTLIRALLDDLEDNERTLAMEEDPEWFLKHPNAIQLKVKRSESGRTFDISDISAEGLTMTMDRYAYGELKAGESMSYFYGAFSGNVSITSLHAASARKAIKKAMIMMKMSGTTIDSNTLLEMLYESTNIIIYLDNFVVAEVVEIFTDGDKVEYNDLWRFNVIKRHTTFIEGEHKKLGHIRSSDMLRKLEEKDLLREEEINVQIDTGSHNILRISRDISISNQHRP